MKIEFGNHPTKMCKQECHRCGKESVTIWAICHDCDLKESDSNKDWYKNGQINKS